MDIPDPRDRARLPRLTELEVARWQPHGETGRVLTNFRPAAR